MDSSVKRLLATGGGDTVKLFDISSEASDPCILSYTPSPGFQVNSVKWNHTNLVVASAGEDKKIWLWRKNGKNLGNLLLDGADNIEETISTINFSSKASRYICSGGSGQVVRIWDLQRKRCIKWLKGHTDSISGVMYNCKDEHLASISLNGNLILHNLASGAKAAELKDPNGQVLRVLDYSKISRHLLATAGDDGSIHLWDTTGRSPKVSWLKQHSAPTSGISISPSNDKILASVGMDKKLYTFDSGSRRPSSCIPFEAPFSSLAFTDDGFTLAAGTSSGRVVFYDVRGKPQPLTTLRAYGNTEAVTSLCWQRSKPVIVNEKSCTTETALLGSAVEDSVLMPDPLPAVISSTSTVGSFSFPEGSISTTQEETPIRSSLWKEGGSLARLQASRNFKDDMEVFSPLVEVQPIMPSLDKLWDNREALRQGSSLLFPPSLRCSLPAEAANDNRPIFNWKSTSLPKQEDNSSSLAPSFSTPISSRIDEPSDITPPEAWGGEKLSDKLMQLRQPGTMPSRFSAGTSFFSGSQDSSLAIGSLSSSSLTLANLRNRENSNEEVSLPSSSTSLPVGTKGGITGLDQTTALPRRFSSYAERISTAPFLSDGTLSVGSPKIKKTGAETREDLLKSLSSRSDAPSINGEMTQSVKCALPEVQQGSSFSLQLLQRMIEETLSASERSNHEGVRNVHIDLIRKTHDLEMQMGSFMKLMLKNQAELMKEVQLLRNETQQLRQLL